MSKTFSLRGRTYDLEDAADLVSIQNVLVPDNWPGKKPDCVRLFLALHNMLTMQFGRHLCANFRTISKAAQEAAADGEAAKVPLSFSFEIDQTAPLVASITKMKMSFTVKHSTTGKPQTYDLTQGELPLDSEDMSDVMNPKSLAKEAEAAGGDGNSEDPPEVAPDKDAAASEATQTVEKPAKKKRTKKKKE